MGQWQKGTSRQPRNLLNEKRYKTANRWYKGSWVEQRMWTLVSYQPHSAKESQSILKYLSKPPHQGEVSESNRRKCCICLNLLSSLQWLHAIDYKFSFGNSFYSKHYLGTRREKQLQWWEHRAAPVKLHLTLIFGMNKRTQEFIKIVSKVLSTNSLSILYSSQWNSSKCKSRKRSWNQQSKGTLASFGIQWYWIATASKGAIGFNTRKWGLKVVKRHCSGHFCPSPFYSEHNNFSKNQIWQFDYNYSSSFSSFPESH